MRKFIIVVVLLLGAIFVISRFTEVEKVANILKTGDWRFVILAVLLEILWLWGSGKTYQSIYKVLGIKEDHKHMLSVAAAANFASVIAPSGGMSGLAVMIADGRKRGHPSARVTVAGAVYLLCEYMAILSAFALALVVLVRRNSLHWPEITAASILLLGVIALLVLLYLANRSARSLGNVLAWSARQGNRIYRWTKKPERFSEEQAREFAREAAACILLLRRSSAPQLARPMLFSIGNKIVLIAILVFVFMAFQVPFSAGTIIAGFSLCYLFVIVSPTPAGIGIVEGVLTLSLRMLGVPLEPAAVVTLAFRGVTFWEPLLIGGYLFRNIGKAER